MITLELNEYTDNFRTEVLPGLEQMVDRTLEREALIINDGAPQLVVGKATKYLQDRDFQVTVETKGVANAN